MEKGRDDRRQRLSQEGGITGYFHITCCAFLIFPSVSKYYVYNQEKNMYYFKLLAPGSYTLCEEEQGGPCLGTGPALPARPSLSAGTYSAQRMPTSDQPTYNHEGSERKKDRSVISPEHRTRLVQAADHLTSAPS